MTSGQVPKIAGHFFGSPARVARTARGCVALAFLVLASVWPAGVPMAQTTQPDAVVPPVKRERPGEAPVKPAEPPAEREPYSVPDTGILGVVQDWLARANREYQGIVVKELSTPGSAPAQDDPIARKLDEQQQEDARKAAGAKAAADAKSAEAARAAEAKRLAEDRRRTEETKRLADEASRKADEILKEAKLPAGDAQKAATETAEQQRSEAQKVADENRRQEERQKAEEQRRADVERQRAEAAKAEAQRIAEEHRQADEAAAADKHRSRTIVLTPEPIERPEPRVMRLASSEADRPVIVDRPHAGTAVKPWVRRVHIGRCHGAGRRVSLPGRYTVKRGDSLWRISKRHYHKGKYYRRIYAANRGRIRDPDLIYPCQRVFVPRKRR